MRIMSGNPFGGCNLQQGNNDGSSSDGERKEQGWVYFLDFPLGLASAGGCSGAGAAGFSFLSFLSFFFFSSFFFVFLLLNRNCDEEVVDGRELPRLQRRRQPAGLEIEGESKFDSK